MLMYTGGTTGPPKGVLLDQRAEMLNLYHVAIALAAPTATTIYLHQTPMFHAASMAASSASRRSAPSVFVPLFDPAAVLDVIERHARDQTVMVPTMVGMLLEHPDFRPERLESAQLLTYGASPMPARVARATARRVAPTVELSQGYGMTESSAVLTILADEDHRRGGESPALGRAAGDGCAAVDPEPDGQRLPVG